MKISVSKYISVSNDGKTKYTTVYRYGNNKYEVSSPYYTSEADDVNNFKKYLRGELFNDKQENPYQEAKKHLMECLLKEEADIGCGSFCDCTKPKDCTKVDEIKALNEILANLKDILTLVKDLKDETKEDEKEIEEIEDGPSEPNEEVTSINDTASIEPKYNLDEEISELKKGIVSLKAELEKNLD